LKYTLPLLLLLASASARADEPRAFATNMRVEAPLVAVGGALWLVSELVKPVLAPDACRLCGRSGLDRAVQQGLVWEDVRPARRLSDALLFGIVPALSLGGLLGLSHRHGDKQTVREDTLVLTETMVVASLLTQLTKYTVARERPFLRTQREHGITVTHGHDDNLSFFSGHTSLTFAMVVGAASIASFRGYEQAPWVWGLGLPLAAFTGYLRIAADRHYFTDVLTGALVGSAIGALVPWLHRHFAQDDGPRVMVSPPGVLTISWLR
jgi:membrane-associated phospholipid phosphatase